MTPLVLVLLLETTRLFPSTLFFPTLICSIAYAHRSGTERPSYFARTTARRLEPGRGAASAGNGFHYNIAAIVIAIVIAIVTSTSTTWYKTD
ncbi:hypothetical protein DFH29DRAFT_957866 [Suillus ampliporus]|nr:hypothetical protein DFH29DRAFT_957866 [Suillus ampliporus]